MAKKEKKYAGNGMGAHNQVSPMGHATRTPSKLEKIRRLEKKGRGWGD